MRAYEMLRSFAKSAVDSYVPSLGTVYRRGRDKLAASASPRTTPFGFQFTGSTAMATGRFESEEAAVFMDLLQSRSVCIDIGANIGMYSCLAASHGKRVVAVEPLAANLDLLYRNLGCNSFIDVEVFPVGLGAKPGIRPLYGGGVMASFISGWAKAPDRWQRMVSVSTLDVIVNNRFGGQRMLIKMDVEGFEGEVLKGAEGAFNLRPRPTWLVEICLNDHFPGGLNQHFVQTFEVFWRHGYQARIADASRRLVTSEDVSRWAAQGHVDFGSHNYCFLEI